MRVIFFQIHNNRSKLEKITQLSKEHFLKKENFLLMVSDLSSAEYVDELLWKLPAESFLPHFVASKSIEEKVVITPKRENLNQAKYIFNLCPTPLLWENAKIIYEFEDLTQSGKQMLSRKKYEAYKEKKYFIECKLT